MLKWDAGDAMLRLGRDGGKVLECCWMGVEVAPCPRGQPSELCRGGVGLGSTHILGGIRACVLGAWVHVPALPCRGQCMFHSNLTPGWAPPFPTQPPVSALGALTTQCLVLEGGYGYLDGLS